MIIREAITEAAQELKKANIETAALDASILLAHILNVNRASLIACGTEDLSEENLAALRALIQRRLNGECVAYITGKKEFKGLEFFINSSVLVPRPDTETLVEAAEQEIREKRKEKKEDIISVLDLCTGSGAVAIALKSEVPELDVWAADISKEVLDVAKENADRLLPDNNIRFLHGGLYDALSPSLLPFPFSLIISNPPYIPTNEIKTLSIEVQNEPRIALDGGKDGLEIIKRIIAGAPDYLIRDGSLLLEADPRQMKEIAGLLEKRGFINIKLYKDLSGMERVIRGRYEN